MQEFDVIICGAGPAGSTCALGLFDSGLKVALLDKQSFPREKVCGDAYCTSVYKILNTISPAFGSQFQTLKLGITTTTIKLTSANGKIYSLKLKVPFSSLPRSVLDKFLWSLVREHSSTSVFENTTVSRIQINEDHVVVNTLSGETFKAKTIVGCDGTHSVVQSWLTKTRESVVDVYPSMRAYYKNVKDVKSNQLEIHYHKNIPKGYFWIFPSTDGLVNVGIGASKNELVKHKINLRKVFFDMIQNQDGYAHRFADAELVGDLKGWSIPIGYFGSKLPITGNRVLLCGDAAALVDPATGEGISPAMSSGRFAAKQLKKCFAENKFSAEFMKGYEKQLHAKYFRSYFFRSLLAEAFTKFPILLECFVFATIQWNRFASNKK